MLSAFGCNGIGCEGCGGRSYPAHETVSVTVPDGGVSVSGGFDNCPTASVRAAPVTARVGQTIAVSGQGSDPDPADANLSYTWSATSGFFGDDGEPQTTFTCTQAGLVTITLTVSDGHCPTKVSVSVFCVAVRDGGIDGPSGAGGATGTGGSGMGGAGGGGMADSCPAAEPSSGGTMCAGCTTANCSLGPSPATDGCCGLEAAADRLLCEAVYACFAVKGCTFTGDPVACFCGSSGGACYSVVGAANGPCVNEVLAAGKSGDPVTIQSRWVSGMLPLGRAVNLAVCRGSFCSSECAIP